MSQDMLAGARVSYAVSASLPQLHCCWPPLRHAPHPRPLTHAYFLRPRPLQLKAPVTATADQKLKAKTKKPLKPGAAFGMARQ